MGFEPSLVRLGPWRRPASPPHPWRPRPDEPGFGPAPTTRRLWFDPTASSTITDTMMASQCTSISVIIAPDVLRKAASGARRGLNRDHRYAVPRRVRSGAGVSIPVGVAASCLR